MIDDEDFEEDLRPIEEEEEEEERKGLPFFEILSGILVVAVGAAVVFGAIKMWNNVKDEFNHVEAGELNLKLERIRSSNYLPDKDGFLVLTENTEKTDFTEATEENIFSLDEKQKITPGCYLESELCVINEDSVEFGYWIEIVVTAGADTLLAEELQLSVITEEKTTTVSLAEGLIIGGENEWMGVVADGESETFTVRIEYPDQNDSTVQTVTFDLIVHAVETGK